MMPAASIGKNEVYNGEDTSAAGMEDIRVGCVPLFRPVSSYEARSRPFGERGI